MKKTLLLLLMSFAPFSILVADDALERGFVAPPDSAKPHTWWHWMNGNVTREGITADLESMQRVGVGGVQIFTADCGILPGPVRFMSPEWSEMIGHAVKEADRLGIELCVHNCAGWSSSGGPWNKPEHGMQRVTISEVSVTGPKKFSDTLPTPPTALDFYRDIAVLAFPAPVAGVSMKETSPMASVSITNVEAQQFADGDPATIVPLPAPQPDQPQYAQLEFQQAFSARLVKMVVGPGFTECRGDIQVSEDGTNFRTVKSFSRGRGDSRSYTVVLGSQPVAARYWRVQFTKGGDLPLAEIELTPELEIENFDAKAGANSSTVLSAVDGSEAAEGCIQRGDIVDLTAKLSANGQLDWNVPDGRWIILRVGYTPNGKKNHPAPSEGTGLECDKLSKEALDAHWAGMMKTVLDAAGPLAGKSLNNALIDSYEVGSQNWTPKFRAEFEKRRGYDPLPFLAVFSRRVVDNPVVSDRFLWDLRQTIADLFAENYFGHFQKLCHEAGLACSLEPYGNGNFEPLQSGAYADIPMGEFWVGQPINRSVKVAATVGHIYGRPVIGAESFTAKSPEHGRWQEDPYALKAIGDSVFCSGINRYIFHRFAMQPWTNRLPGMTMGPWGSHFDRTSTWWEQGRAWLKYVARCQFLLQQGRFVADAAYFSGDRTWGGRERRLDNPSLPKGYDYDGVNVGVLETASVQDGQLVLKSGMRYRVLILPPDDTAMTPETLRLLSGLVSDGLTLVGPPPAASPSLAGYPQCDADVKALAANMWGNADGKSVTENKVGRGKVVWGQTMEQVLAGLNLKPDFEFNEKGGAKLQYIHRLVGPAEIYFISNQKDAFQQVDCTFRVSGKVPELWDAESGRMVIAPVWHEQDGRTTVSLALTPVGSVFVVFREPAGRVDHVVAVNHVAKVPAVAPTIEILRARYEALDGSRGADVTATIAGLVKEGALSIRVDNELFGDPVYGHVKHLRVAYTLYGKTQEQVVAESNFLELGGAFANANDCEVIVGMDGQTLVSATAPCAVELTTVSGKILKAEVRDVPKPVEIVGPWGLSFPPDAGAPAEIILDQLISWTEHEEQGVKYFSGTATYHKEIEISAESLGAGRSLLLDLGRVKNLAEVTLNGQKLGILWKPPFRVDITAAAKPGKNRLVVKITNLWANRLIGDEQLPADCEWDGVKLKRWPQWLLDGKPSPSGRLTFTTWHHWTKDDKPLESGLLGPVTLQTAVSVPAK